MDGSFVAHPSQESRLDELSTGARIVWCEAEVLAERGATRNMVSRIFPHKKRAKIILRPLDLCDTKPNPNTLKHTPRSTLSPCMSPSLSLAFCAVHPDRWGSHEGNMEGDGARRYREGHQ